MAFTYVQGAELPDIELTWRDDSGAIIDFSTGWTFTARIGVLGQSATLTKTTGIVGDNTSPNITITWDSTELNSIPAATYAMHVIARFTSSGKDRILEDELVIKPAVLA